MVGEEEGGEFVDGLTFFDEAGCVSVDAVLFGGRADDGFFIVDKCNSYHLWVWK